MAKILSSENFEQEVMKAELPVLVDFYADWCGPCKMMAPIMDTLSIELEGQAKVCKLNVDNERELAAKYSVMSIPTMCIFKGGEVVDKIIGSLPKDTLEARLKKFI
jgi:thioredoxin 1